MANHDVSVNLEDEKKYEVHGLFAMPDLNDPDLGVARVEPRGRLVMRATYYDAPDLRLAREGITLRHRTGEGAPVWTLKLPAGGSAREELTLAGPGREVPQELRDLLIAWLRGAAPQPVATLRTSRDVSVLLGPEEEELAEVVDDTVSVVQGRRVVSRFREVEVERRAPPSPEVTTSLAAVGSRLVEAGATRSAQLPKVVRALGPRAVAPGELPQPEAVGPNDHVGELVTTSLRTGVRRMLIADVGVRRGNDDAVHQMRVACRRMRSDLKTFRPLVESLWAESLRVELKWLATALGDARDLEVLRLRLRDIGQRGSPIPYDMAALERLDQVLASQEDAALAEAADALRSERYLRLVEVLLDAAREPVLTDAANSRCSRALPPLVRGAWAAMAKRTRQLHADDPDDTWHEARLRAKQARYAAEAVLDVLGRPAARLADAAKAVQEVLGEHQDAALAAQKVATLAGEHLDDGELCLAAGRLVEANRCAIADSRARFPAVWKRAEKAGG